MLCTRVEPRGLLNHVFFVALAMLALAATRPALAAKTDIVVLQNGDRITGEVKKLDRGRLRYSTNDLGTVYIEWDKIATVVSREFHRLQLEDGTILYGRLSDTGGPGTLAVQGDRGTEPVPIMRFISITPVEKGWVERTDLTIGAGYGYTKASDVTTFNAYVDTEYQGEKITLLGSLRSDYTDDGDEGTSRNRLTGEYRRLTGHRNYRFITGAAEQNDELDLDLRVGIGAGLGRYFIQNNRRRLLAGGGLGVFHEENGDGSSSTEVTGLIAAQYDDFLYDTPKIDLVTTLTVLPLITDAGRVLTNYDVTLRKEFIEDLFLDLSFNGSYDTDPSSEDASNADYRFTTGISYDF